MPTAAEIQDAGVSLSEPDLSVETTIDAGVPRDDKGRFRSIETALDAAPEAPVAPATPEPLPEGAPDPAVQGTETVATEPPPVEVTDWKFSTQRRDQPIEIVIPGAKYAKGHGVLIPDTDEAQALFKQTMNRAALYPHVQQQLQETRGHLQAGVTRHQVENVAMGEQLKRLLDPSFYAEALGIDPTQVPDTLRLALDRIQVALERKMVELERVAGPHILSDANGAATPDQFVIEQLNDAFDDILVRVAPGLSVPDRQALEQDIEGYATAFVRRGRNGAEVLPDKMERYIADWVKARVAASPPPVTATPPSQPKAAPQAPTTADVAKRNQAAAQSKVAAPPSAGGSARNLAAPPPKQPKAGDGAFKSPADVHAYFGR